MASNPDLTDLATRVKIIQEINGENNKAVKRASLKAFEIYRMRQADFIVEKLREEFDFQTVKNMRKILSINMSRRIVNELASIYDNKPERTFGDDLTDAQQEQVENLYFEGDVDNKMKLANRYFKLANQTAIQVIPKKGKIQIRPLLRHHYDVIPDRDNPEEPFAYILNVFDKFNFLANTEAEEFSATKVNDDTRPQPDRRNQDIADESDFRAKLSRFIVWTKDLHFEMDGNGQILDEDITNPIGELPFIDIAEEKDFEFFVREGHSITDFCVDMGAMLSDLANIMRLQGYAQAVISSDKPPKNLVIGPNHVLHLQQDPANPQLNPRFEFVSPTPNLEASLEIIETKIRFFLNSMGIDPKMIGGDLQGQRFNSGIERLLAMVEKFEASQNDFELFRRAEERVFRLMVKWSNAFQGVTDPETKLVDSINITKLPEDLSFSVQFSKPQMIRTQSEEEDSVIKLMEKGLMTKKEAIMELRGVGEDQAQAILDEIEEAKGSFMNQMMQARTQLEQPEDEDGSSEVQEEQS